jgi:hypothetical protein
MQVRTAENLARLNAAKSGPASSDEERLYQAASAAAIAAETAAALPTLPSGERASAAIWIDVLNECAKDFMAGDILPRPRPGDLSAMMPPNP